MAPTWNNSARVFTCTGKSCSSLVNFSSFQRHHYRSLIDTSCTFPCNLHALPLFSPCCLTFPLRNDRSRAQRVSAAWHFPSFTKLYTEITPAVYILHPPCFLCDSSPLVVFAPSTAAYTFRFAYRTVFAVFCVFCFVLARTPCFFCVSVLAKLSTPIFPWGGAFLYSGFTFSHYDLPFPTRYSIPYVRSSLYQLVIRVKGFRVCAPLRMRNNLNYALHSVLSIGVDTTLSGSRVMYR